MKRYLLFIATAIALQCHLPATAQTIEPVEGNYLFVNAGYSSWSTKLTLPDESEITPTGQSLTLGYNRMLGISGIGVGAIFNMFRGRFDYEGNRCGTDMFGVFPDVSLRSLWGRFLFGMHLGFGPAIYSENVNSIFAFSPLGWGYALGLECGFMFTQHTALTLGYDICGSSFEGNSQKSERIDYRLGLAFVF